MATRPLPSSRTFPSVRRHGEDFMTRSKPLLLSAASLAMASALLLPSAAQAQAFNGTPSVVRGSATIDRSVAKTDTITVSTRTAVIDWTPFEDGSGKAKTFLPRGSTAIFQNLRSASGTTDFAVLNRILPSSNGDVAIIDGTVISRVNYNFGPGAGDSSRGGTVAFYSPNGLLIGNSAVFDVGHLLLTTLAPDLDSFDSYLDGGTLQLTGSSGQTAGVRIAGGAQITAPRKDSSFVVAAPRVAMNGTAYVNGSTAYVAGEQVNISYDNGLFDIEIPVGTTVDTAMWHTGSTGGPARTTTGENHMIYAVGKGQGNPITMLFGGNLGFDPVVTAGVYNGEVILSAGYDVHGRTMNVGPVAHDAPEETIRVVRKTLFKSRTDIAATGWFTANTNHGSINFRGGLDAWGARGIGLLAQDGKDLLIGGSPDLTSYGYVDADGNSFGGIVRSVARSGATLSVTGGYGAVAVPPYSTGDTTGGSAIIIADGGTFQTEKGVGLRADANVIYGAGGTFIVDGGHSYGGFAKVLAKNSGTIDVGTSLVLVANGSAGNGRARDGLGGVAVVEAESGGTINVTEILGAYASGSGSSGDRNLGLLDGRDGIGGYIRIKADGGSISAGNAELRARGGSGSGVSQKNGYVTGDPIDRGGTARGGTVLVAAHDGSISLGLNIDLIAIAGNGADGGDAYGGKATVVGSGASVISLGRGSFDTWAFGGEGVRDGGFGGSGAGGEALVATFDTALIHATNFYMDSQGYGGVGTNGGLATSVGAGIHAIGGTIDVDGRVTMLVNAQPRECCVADELAKLGEAQAGTAFIQADGSLTNPATITIGENADMFADALGRNATGGTIKVLAGRDTGSINIVRIKTYARGEGFNGTGTGGTAIVGTFAGLGDGSLGNGELSTSLTSIYVNGSGFRDSDIERGGTGIGGTAQLVVDGGHVDAGAVEIRATGSGNRGASGGNGTGGSVTIDVLSGSLDASSALIYASGSGAYGTTGNGGIATGGTVAIRSAGSFTIGNSSSPGDLDVTATASGGDSRDASGGAANGGSIDVTVSNAGRLSIAGSTSLDAGATGKGGPTGGGDAAGGEVSLLTDNATDSMQAAEFLAGATSYGGSATGGTVSVEALNGGTASAVSLVLDASAVNTGSGTGEGGSVSLVARSGALIDIGDLTVDVSGTTTDGSYDIVEDGGTIQIGTSNVPTAQAPDEE
ncbi:beta strand repeat-containing protein [Qipengyuania mesophila]|uniref:beta strand repeat-containing protein n=1 Tax=Qipengyuania mesophila TaxID=2867246 RepID=UPI003517EF3C